MLRFRTRATVALACGLLTTAAFAQAPFEIYPVQVLSDAYVPGTGGSPMADSALRLVALDYSRHGLDEVAVLTTAGDLYLLATPAIHQEYKLLWSGATAVAVLEEHGADGADALVVSDATGIHLLQEGSAATLLSSDSALQNAARIVVGDCNGDQLADLVVHDLTVPGASGDEQITLVEQTSSGWSILGSRSFSGQLGDIEVAPDWLGTGDAAVFVLCDNDLYCCDPASSPAVLADAYPAFTVPSALPGAQIEVIDDFGVSRLLIAYSIEPSAGSYQSALVIAIHDSGATNGLLLAQGIVLREEKIRGLSCGSYFSDGFIDIILTYGGLSNPDLYLSGLRYGATSLFLLDHDLVVCLVATPHPPQVTSELVFVDFDGDGKHEFAYGTDYGSSDTVVAAARDPAGPDCVAPTLADGDWGPGAGTLGGTGFSLPIPLGEQPSLWTATHVELILWRILEDASTGDLYTERTPFRQTSVAIPTSGSSVDVDVTADSADWLATGFVGVVRFVEDSDLAIPGVQRAGPPARFLMRPDFVGGASAGYWTEMYALVDTNGALEAKWTGDGGIPLIIDPLPPLPPLPPAPPAPTNQPVTGTGATNGAGSGED